MSEVRSAERMTDRDLVQRAVRPSSPRERELALRAIYDRYSADVLGLCGWWLSDPDAAMDAAQGTFETAIKDLTGYGRADQPTLREPDKLGAWLRGIAKNQCRAEWRRRNREGEFPEEDLEDAEHEVTASRRRQAQVDRILDTVAVSFTERQQLIFQLVLRQGLRGHACPPSRPGPHTQSSGLFAPTGGNLPTFAVLTARTAAGRKSAYAPEGISCTLPPGQVLICSAALRYFLIQAAGPDTPPATLKAALNALGRFVTAHSAAKRQ